MARDYIPGLTPSLTTEDVFSPAPLQMSWEYEKKQDGLPTWVIIVIVLVIAILAAVFISTLLHKTGSNNPAPPTQIRATPPPHFTSNSNPGISNNGLFGNQSNNGSFFRDSITCTTAAGADRRYWSQEWSSCQCRSPYWGDQCQNETYSHDFFAVGRPAIGDVQGDIISSNKVSNISFPLQGSEAQSSCTERCVAHPNCKGIYWQSDIEAAGGAVSGGTVGGTCTLLGGTISINEGKSIPFDPHVDSTLYLKGYNSRPTINNSVFLIKDNVPLRYWLYDRQTLSSAQQGGPSSLLQVQKGKQYQLDFVPTTVINDGALTGVYSNAPLSASALTGGVGGTEMVIPENGTVLIHRPGTILDTNHPVHAGGQVWVTYI